jgi:hypothetical protein
MHIFMMIPSLFSYLRLLPPLERLLLLRELPEDFPEEPDEEDRDGV